MPTVFWCSMPSSEGEGRCPGRRRQPWGVGPRGVLPQKKPLELMSMSMGATPVNSARPPRPIPRPCTQIFRPGGAGTDAHASRTASWRVRAMSLAKPLVQVVEISTLRGDVVRLELVAGEARRRRRSCIEPIELVAVELDVFRAFLVLLLPPLIRFSRSEQNSTRCCAGSSAILKQIFRAGRFVSRKRRRRLRSPCRYRAAAALVPQHLVGEWQGGWHRRDGRRHRRRGRYSGRPAAPRSWCSRPARS